MYRDVVPSQIQAFLLSVAEKRSLPPPKMMIIKPIGKVAAGTMDPMTPEVHVHQICGS